MVSFLPMPPLVSLPGEDRAAEDEGGGVFDDGSEAVVGDGLVVDDGLAGDEVCCSSFDDELENSGVRESVENELERCCRAEFQRRHYLRWKTRKMTV